MRALSKNYFKSRHKSYKLKVIMPPTKKKKPKASDWSIESVQDSVEVEEINNMATLPSGLANFLDQRLRVQTEQINDLFVKFSGLTKSDLQEIKKSQEFLATKFDDLEVSLKKLKDENTELHKTNTQLNERIGVLEQQSTLADIENENVKRYLRRDLLEIHGIPESAEENTNNLVKQVADLIAPELNISESDISISHRLPAPHGRVKPIIVKFTRRDSRDAIYSKRRNLSSKKSTDLGFHVCNRLYINESLTAQSRKILHDVKEFQRAHEFKYVWTKQGKVLLKKDSHQSEVHVFETMKVTVR